jgi:glycosyltransferase involved in cell wall biosynthesis
MNIVFLSNYLNPHISPLCDAFAGRPEVDFSFISTSSGAPESGAIKKAITGCPYSYSLNGEISDNPVVLSKIQNADVVIVGAANVDFSKLRFSSKTIFFKYSERFLKKGFDFHLLHLLSVGCKFRKRFPKNSYLLCASAYAMKDYSLAGLFHHRCLNFGYFPMGNANHSVGLDQKWDEEKAISLLWCGRLLSLKHPEMAIEADRHLTKKGIEFNLEIIGDGPEWANIKAELARAPFNRHVILSGQKDNEYVLQKMLSSNVFLFTSDRQEGWGSVVNEAMSSQCCLVASREAGSVPFLIQDGVNGFSYSSKKEFLDKVYIACRDFEVSKKLAKNARETILNQWNATVAVANLLSFVDCIRNGKKMPDNLINNGPGTIIL